MLKRMALVLSILLFPFAVNAQDEKPNEQETAAPRLSEVKKIYIDKMPNDLDKYLTAEMVKKFKGELQPVGNAESADAVMSGTGEDQQELLGKVTGRFFNLHDTATAAIVLLDKSGSTIIWADEAGDRSLVWGVVTRGGLRKVASRIMKHLDAAIREDAKKASK